MVVFTRIILMISLLRCFIKLRQNMVIRQYNFRYLYLENTLDFLNNFFNLPEVHHYANEFRAVILLHFTFSPRMLLKFGFIYYEDPLSI